MVLTILKEGMIALHNINPNKLALTKLKQNIFGFDKKSVWTLKNLRSPEGDTSYRNQWRTPTVGFRDAFRLLYQLVCRISFSTLAAESGGSVFTRQSLGELWQARLNQEHARCNVTWITIKTESDSLCRFVTVYLIEKGEEEWFAMSV